jgi:hypothetical protein
MLLPWSKNIGQISAEPPKNRRNKQSIGKRDRDNESQNDDVRRISSEEWLCSRARQRLEKPLPEATTSTVRQRAKSDNCGSIELRPPRSLSASARLLAPPEVL